MIGGCCCCCCCCGDAGGGGGVDFNCCCGFIFDGQSRMTTCGSIFEVIVVFNVDNADIIDVDFLHGFLANRLSSMIERFRRDFLFNIKFIILVSKTDSFKLSKFYWEMREYHECFSLISSNIKKIWKTSWKFNKILVDFLISTIFQKFPQLPGIFWENFTWIQRIFTGIRVNLIMDITAWKLFILLK